MFFAFMRKKRFVIILVSGLLVTACLFIVCTVFRVPSKAFCEGVGEYSLLAGTQSEREAFFLPFGYKATSIGQSGIRVPSCGTVYEQYNEIQKSQGLDLEPYSGEDAVMYTFSLEDGLYGFLTVYKDRVIGAHISDCLYPASVRGLCG